MARTASSFLYRSLQPPAAVSSAQLLQEGDPALLLLHDTHISSCLVNSDGLEQHRSWRSPCSILQMVLLPHNQLLLLAEGGHCSLHSLQPGGAAPTQLALTQLPAASESEPLVMQSYGCVISSNTLSAEVAPGAAASLLAVSYEAGVLHLVKAAPQAAAAAAGGCGSMSLTAKHIPYRQAVLSCHCPGEPIDITSVWRAVLHRPRCLLH